MKSQSYMTRAMRARDPRYARILGKLGYGRSDMIPTEPDQDDMEMLRAEYFEVIGKRPFHGWDAGTLKTKIAESKG